MNLLSEGFLGGIPGIRIKPAKRIQKAFHPLALALCLLAALAGTAHAVRLDCAVSGTCQTEVQGTIHLGTGDVPLPGQFVPSANPQQPDTFWINSPGMPQNVTFSVPASISIFGFVGFKAEPWVNYDLTFVNNTASNATYDLLWNTDVSGGPYHWAYSSLNVDTTTPGGTAGANSQGAYMQTATFESASNWVLPLGTGNCANTDCSFSTSVDFGGTSTISRIDLALDFTLSPGGTAHIQGFAGLDQTAPSEGAPEPSSVCLIASGLAAAVLGAGKFRRRRT